MITPAGRIETELVVNACGMWAPQVAAMVGAFAPSVPVDHQHIALHAVDGHELPREMPCFRDTDNLVYGRSEAGGVLFGGYEPNPVARWVDGVPWDHAGRVLPADPDRFAQLMEGAARRFPFLEDAGVVTLVCHPDAMTPDGNPLLGPMPGVPGFWMAAGLSLNGFGGAGGIGKTIAEWITTGETELDVHGYRAWRFGAPYRHPDALEAAGRETYKYYYRLRYPLDAAEWGRPGRVSPLHGRTQDLGAVYGAKNGWERPDYYLPGRPSRRAGADQREYGWTQPPEFERLAREHAAFRERVGIIDMTSFGKIEVEGPAAARPARPRVREPDRPAGGKRRLHPVVQQARRDRCRRHRHPARADRFRVVTGAGVVDSDLGWLELHRRDGEPVSLREASAELAVIGIWGPRARDVLPGSHARRRWRRRTALPGRTRDRRPLAPRCSRSGSPTSANWATSSTSRPSGPCRCGMPCGRPVPGTASSRAATACSSRCAWRRATATWAPTSRPATTPTRPGSGSASRSTRATSSAAMRWPRRPRIRRNGRCARSLSGGEDALPSTAARPSASAGGPSGGCAAAPTGTACAATSPTPTCRPAPTADARLEVEVLGEPVAAEVAADVLYDPGHERVRG